MMHSTAARWFEAIFLLLVQLWAGIPTMTRTKAILLVLLSYFKSLQDYNNTYIAAYMLRRFYILDFTASFTFWR